MPAIFLFVFTANAHYARENDRAVHLVCRSAGRDRPLSDYPEPIPGLRYLQTLVSLKTLVSPLLKLFDSVNEVVYPDTNYDNLQLSQNAMIFAFTRPLENPLAATWHIAQRCNVDLDLGTFHFPEVAVPEGETAYSLLAKRCLRYRPPLQAGPPKAVELLEKELRTIQDMGFAHYFLVVHDIVRWARAQGIACSGRGSAGNSIVCHALDITASEPIRHNLLFERFLNPNRREMLDIDVDFCSARRDEVVAHIYKTFGEENVAVVANVNTMEPPLGRADRGRSSWFRPQRDQRPSQKRAPARGRGPHTRIPGRGLAGAA